MAVQQRLARRPIRLAHLVKLRLKRERTHAVVDGSQAILILRTVIHHTRQRGSIAFRTRHALANSIGERTTRVVLRKDQVLELAFHKSDAIRGSRVGKRLVRLVQKLGLRGVCILLGALAQCAGNLKRELARMETAPIKRLLHRKAQAITSAK